MRKWMRWANVAVVVLVFSVLVNGVGSGGLEGGGGVGLSGDLPEDPVLGTGYFCSTPPTGANPVEWCNYVRTVQNLDFIVAEVESMAFFSFQYPETYAQLGQSIYACVREQDIINPYTGQPVQVESDPSPGNIRWTYNPETKDLTVETAFIFNGERAFYTRNLPGSDLAIYQQQEQEDPYPKYPPDATENVKRSWMCGWILDDYITFEYPTRLQTPNDDGPPTYAELLRRFPVLKKMWNPFQNRFIQEIPMNDGWASAHPGDMSYTRNSETEYEFYVWGEGDEEGKGQWIY